ncbi:hypothetical protein H9636_15905 [Ureibacillus sp. Re31]|uniref:Uncharacterized protein n=1 Tax=Ureibacillus galli TaxID=2762222 RepID=A0ABR8XFZ3_9BACL|nr:hypothetical protein [Ureibacillus galli]MBD8028132.1 hypothetical protein [Ureibacillus galli]
MIDFNAADLIHKNIILDLTKRTLERDLNHLNDIKINRPLTLWMEQQITVVQNELREVKSQLGKNGIKVQAEIRIDKDITEYIILFKGTEHNRRYFNVALKNKVDDEIKRLLNVQ